MVEEPEGGLTTRDGVVGWWGPPAAVAAPSAMSSPQSFGRMVADMELAQVRRILEQHGDELAAMGVASLMVFGSVARNEERPDSDVDMLVEFSRPTGLFGLIRLRLFLEERFGCPVDLGTPDSLRPGIREAALAEAVRVA